MERKPRKPSPRLIAAATLVVAAIAIGGCANSHHAHHRDQPRYERSHRYEGDRHRHDDHRNRHDSRNGRDGRDGRDGRGRRSSLSTDLGVTAALIVEGDVVRASKILQTLTPKSFVATRANESLS